MHKLVDQYLDRYVYFKVSIATQLGFCKIVS